jgi:2-oxoisovalerate dehydrogenase E1 component alpha subunit
VIELFTYRAEGHSTSDDPARYRPAEEAKGWPLGDPIDRLRAHLIALGEWSDAQQDALQKAVVDLVKAAGKEAETHGTLSEGKRPSVKTMFDDVYKEQPWHIRRQRQEMGV